MDEYPFVCGQYHAIKGHSIMYPLAVCCLPRTTLGIDFGDIKGVHWQNPFSSSKIVIV